MRKIAQNIPPFRKIHAACKKFILFPKSVQSYIDDNPATRTAPIRRINPINSSDHLFIVFSDGGFYLKIWWSKKNIFEMLKRRVS